MSYVDLIIKYLSGDLSRDESSSFEKELERNEELRRTFEEHSAAFELIREQLQKRDLLAFKSKLAEVMDPEVPVRSSRKPGLRPWWLIPPAVACSIAILLVLLLHDPGTERVFSRFYHPTTDPVVLAYAQDTRGETEPGISQFLGGDYHRAMELLSEAHMREQDNKLILIYFLLSSMELDREQEVLELVGQQVHEPLDLLDQSLSWYTVLALIKSERREAALEKLHPLTELQGPYRSDALRLEKVLLK